MTVINPTPGRVVWFIPHGHPPHAEPYAAIITFVHDVRLVNLCVFNYAGTSFPATSIVLVQEGDDKPDQAYAKWMPYQIGQAKKHENVA